MVDKGEMDMKTQAVMDDSYSMSDSHSMSDSPKIITLRNVCAGYEEKADIIKNIDLDIELGKVTVLAGPNGCGKSTLLKVITGLLTKTSGEVTVDSQTAEAYKQTELAKRIAYLPQSRNVPEISVMRMVLHGRFPYLKYPRRYRKIDMEIAEEALKQVGMEDYADENVSRLSGGMQQKVYIAMALAQDTPVVLMDEPTSFLDIAHQLRLMDMARQLAKQGKAVVLVLHDIAMALKVADNIVVMSEGAVMENGSPEQVFESGVLNKVFGVNIKRMETEDGWQYYVQ